MGHGNRPTIHGTQKEETSTIKNLFLFIIIFCNFSFCIFFLSFIFRRPFCETSPPFHFPLWCLALLVFRRIVEKKKKKNTPPKTLLEEKKKKNKKQKTKPSFFRFFFFDSTLPITNIERVPFDITKYRTDFITFLRWGHVSNQKNYEVPYGVVDIIYFHMIFSYILNLFLFFLLSHLLPRLSSQKQNKNQNISEKKNKKCKAKDISVSACLLSSSFFSPLPMPLNLMVSSFSYSFLLFFLLNNIHSLFLLTFFF